LLVPALQRFRKQESEVGAGDGRGTRRGRRDHPPPPHGSSMTILQSPSGVRRSTSALRPDILTDAPAASVPASVQRFATSAVSAPRTTCSISPVSVGLKAANA